MRDGFPFADREEGQDVNPSLGGSITANAWNRTRVSDALAVEYPIIQGPLGGFSSQRLTAAVSNFGGLGSFGAHGLEPSAIEDIVHEIRSLTTKPFAMNLWVSMEDADVDTSDVPAFNRALSHVAPHVEAVGGIQPAFLSYKKIRFEDQQYTKVSELLKSLVEGVEKRRQQAG